MCAQASAMVMKAEKRWVAVQKVLHQSGGSIVWLDSYGVRLTSSALLLRGAGTALVLAVVVPNVEFIFGLVGSTASVFIAYLLPAILFLSLSGRPALLSQLNPADVATGASPIRPPPSPPLVCFILIPYPALRRGRACQCERVGEPRWLHEVPLAMIRMQIRRT